MSTATSPSYTRWMLSALAFLALRPAHAQDPPASSRAAVQTIAQNQSRLLQGSAARGQELYQQCTSCHSVDENDIGPKHRGVVGRKAGTAPDYAYSPALKNSGIVWDAASLDRWLTNPSAMVPGTKMHFLIKDPQSRADIIAYLSELK